MSQLRASINFSLREKELQKNQIQFLNSNTSPIEIDSEISIQDIDEDVDEDNNIITSEHWELELKNGKKC